MRDIIDEIERWLEVGENSIALATVIESWGSAPRKGGAKMAFTAGGAAIAGSVSGGCVEGAVIAAGDEVLATGRPQLLHFGVADETAWGVGLACGGTIDIFIERLDAALVARTRQWIDAGTTGAIVTVVQGPDEVLGRKLIVDAEGVTGSLGTGLDETAAGLARSTRQSTRRWLADGIEVFIDAIQPPPTLFIVGGAHIAVALVRLAQVVGFRTVVIDPRRAFGSAERFPLADELIQAWPDKAFAAQPIGAGAAVVTLSHDPKIDDPALHAALLSDAFYVGALGSRRTHERRRARLAALGFGEAELGRIHAPIGLDIGAENPEEIALAVLAEVVAAFRAVAQGS